MDRNCTQEFSLDRLRTFSSMNCSKGEFPRVLTVDSQAASEYGFHESDSPTGQKGCQGSHLIPHSLDLQAEERWVQRGSWEYTDSGFLSTMAAYL